MLDAPSAYNIISGRSTINAFQAAVSTYHQKIKFSMGDQVGEEVGNQRSTRNCYMEMVRIDQKKAWLNSKKNHRREEVRVRDGNKPGLNLALH